MQLSICLQIINYLAERLGWKEYGRETQLESWELMPSENPLESEIVKLRNDGVNQRRKGSQLPRVECTGTPRPLARLAGRGGRPFTKSGQEGEQAGRDLCRERKQGSIQNILCKRCLWDIKVEKKVWKADLYQHRAAAMITWL